MRPRDHPSQSWAFSIDGRRTGQRADAEQGRPVKSWALSRDTFYRYRDAVEEGGSRPSCCRGRAGFSTTRRTGSMGLWLWSKRQAAYRSVEYPAHGQVRVSNELRKRACSECRPSGASAQHLASPSTWRRHFKPRLKDARARQGAGNEGIRVASPPNQAQAALESTPRIRRRPSMWHDRRPGQQEPGICTAAPDLQRLCWSCSG